LEGSWPEFTPCFQETVLVWAPCGMLWVVSPLYLCCSHVHRRTAQPLAFSSLYLAKLVSYHNIACLLACLQRSTCAKEETCMQPFSICPPLGSCIPSSGCLCIPARSVCYRTFDFCLVIDQALLRPYMILNAQTAPLFYAPRGMQGNRGQVPVRFPRIHRVVWLEVELTTLGL